MVLKVVRHCVDENDLTEVGTGMYGGLSLEDLSFARGQPNGFSSDIP
jgi:hypothetical protein